MGSGASTESAPPQRVIRSENSAAWQPRTDEASAALSPVRFNPARKTAPSDIEPSRTKRSRSNRAQVLNQDLKNCVIAAWDETDLADETPSFPRRSLAANRAIELALDYYCFDGVSIESKNNLARSFVKKTYKQGDFIYEQGAPSTVLYVMEQGEVEFLVDGEVVGVVKDSEARCFGELGFIYGINRSSSARAASPEVLLWSLARVDFHKVQVSASMESLEKSFRSAQCGRTTGILPDQAETLQELAIVPGTTIDPFMVIGAGTAGIVYMTKVKDGKFGQVCAMKRMWKWCIQCNDMQQRVLFERDSMALCSKSPFVLKLLHTFQDAHHVYFISELAQGGDLMEAILDFRDRGALMSEYRIRFYGACLLSAIQHVHSCGIIHRDVKPENCLIGRDGFLKLGDFGLAKPLPCVLTLGSGRVEVSPVSYTMCGSPQFLAPEVFLNTGYRKTADWWSFGCVLFELFFGRSPFPPDLESLSRSVMAIGLGRQTILDFISPSEQARDPRTLDIWVEFLHGLLTQDAMRLNSTMVKSTTLFRDFDWKALEEKRMDPGWVPDLQGDVDDHRFPNVPSTQIPPDDVQEQWKQSPLNDTLFYSFGQRLPDLGLFPTAGIAPNV